MLVIAQVLLSIGAIYAFIPIIIILILIAAAAGLMRGTDIFAFFGIGTLMGMASGAGRGAGKGFSGGNKYRSSPAKSGTIFGFAGAQANKLRNLQRQPLIKQGQEAQNRLETLSRPGSNPAAPLQAPGARGANTVKLAVFSGRMGAIRNVHYKVNKALLSSTHIKNSEWLQGRAAQGITNMYKKQLKMQLELDKKNWQNFGATREEAFKNLAQKYQSELQSISKERAGGTFSGNLKATYSSKAALAKAPFVGKVLDIANAPKSFNNALKPANAALKEGYIGEYALYKRVKTAPRYGSKEHYESEAVKRFEKGFKPEEFTAYNKAEDSYQLRIESQAERLRQSAEAERARSAEAGKKALAAKSKAEAKRYEKEKSEHDSKAAYYSEAAKTAQQVSSNFYEMIEKEVNAAKRSGNNAKYDYWSKWSSQIKRPAKHSP
ncbi:MAG: hypothetical protein ACP5UH_02555 [Candidatus Micrarchaeia archaeon]